MNNFDAWKESLTPDEAYDAYVSRKNCAFLCPAKYHCLPWNADILSNTRRCQEKFFEWAAKEADC